MESGDLDAAARDFERALTYPKNLNVGRPAQPLEARALFWQGRLLEAQGDAQRARQIWTRCASNDPATGEQRQFIGECRNALSRR